MISVPDRLPPEDTFRLREYLGVIAYRKWSIILITAVAAIGAVLFAKQQTPMYTSSITVILTDPLGSINGQSLTRTGPNPSVEIPLVTAVPVQKCAQAILTHAGSNQLNADLSSVCSDQALASVKLPSNLASTLTAGGGTNAAAQSQQGVAPLMVISDSDPGPRRAQAVTQAFALAYQNYKVTQATTQLNALRAPIQSQLDGLNKQVSRVNSKIAHDIANNDAAALSSHEQERQSLETQSNDLQQSLLVLAPAKVQAPQVPAGAPLPQSPSSPNTPLDGAAGFAAGLAIGIAIAFLRERLDDRIRGRTDVERHLEAPVLAVIPKVPGWRKREDAKLVTIEQPKSPAAEAYRTLRSGILFSGAQRGVKVVMVASPGAGEGKTTTVANLGIALAGAGKRTIVISADLHRPRLHQFFGLDNDRGLCDILLHEGEPHEMLRDQDIENLRIITSGPTPARPGELLQSQRMEELILTFREVADFVLLDTVPVLFVADALSMVPLVDAVLLVVDAQNTTRSAIAHARDQLQQVDAPIIGAVVNDFDPSARGYGYRYGYGYGYGYSYAYYGNAGYGASFAKNGWSSKRRQLARAEEERQP